ncbi:MAG: hypothetical protein KatS3mg102_2956 [Planctomycetota bacterium]|nr:MAG: hypothetical protein KatS3mg102_2956 [Planctomycetota bacterium]
MAGRWLAPQEVEGALLAHPAVAECAVVAAPDPQGLLKPVAFVVPAAGAGAASGGQGGGQAAELAERLQRFVAERLEGYKVPRRVVLCEALPRTHLGKVDRGRLGQQARALLAARRPDEG